MGGAASGPAPPGLKLTENVRWVKKFRWLNPNATEGSACFISGLRRRENGRAGL